MSNYKYKTMLLKSKLVKGNSYVQWLVAILANTTMLTYGLQSGWISPMSKVLQADSSPLAVPLSDAELSWVASTMSLAAVVGVSIYTYIADTYGRRVGIIAIAVPQALCWIIKLFASNATGIIIARICCGIPAGGCFNLIPMYVKEISEDSIRGALGSLMILMQNVGLLAMYAMGSYMEYNTVLWAVVGIPIVTALLMLKAPESPAFLIKVGKVEEATATVAFLRGLDVSDKIVQNEVSYMSNDDLYYKTLPQISYGSILRKKAWRNGFILSTVLITLGSLNGCFSILTYASTILTTSGVTFSPELQALSFPAVMIVGSFICMCCIERVGRKCILISTFLVTTVSLTCLASSQYVAAAAAGGGGGVGPAAPRWLPVLAMVTTLWAYAAGICPMPYIVMSEMFNFQIRAKAIGFIVTHAWLMSFVQLVVYGWLPDPHTAFFCFAGVNLAGALVCLRLPETRGKTVDEIEVQLAGK